MKLKLNVNYFKYILMVLFIFIDSLFLCLINNNKLVFTFYSLINFFILFIVCAKINKYDCITFSILFLLFYTFFVDVYIHYFHKYVFFEAEYLYCVPLFVTCFRVKNENSKLFILVSTLLFFINLLVLFFNQSVSFWNYLIFIPYILTFIAFYYIFNNVPINSQLLDLFKFLFIMCLFLTLIQTAAGFHQDTRNAVFSVYGWGAYTIFIMFYGVYNFAKYINKEKSLIQLIFCVFICCLLFICTESKAAIVMLFISMLAMLLLSKGISIKKILILILAISMIPISFKVMIKYNPKFANFYDLDRIIGYYTGNNDIRYKYGRFEALKVVYNDLSDTDKIFGVGFGSSVPLNHNMYEELGRNIKHQYYINIYGYRHGFQNTSTAILILDGGLVLLITVIIFAFTKLFYTIKNYTHKKSFVDFIRFGMFFYVAYLFVYSNIFKDFRYMAIIGIIFGMNKLLLNSKTELENEE